MSNRRNKKKKRKLAVRGPRRAGANDSGIRQLYRHACELSERGDHEAARRLYGHLEATVADSRLKALIRNDLGVLAAIAGDAGAALQGFEAALAADAQCEPARANRTFWEAEFPEHPEEPVRSPPPRAPLEAGTATPCIPNPPPIEGHKLRAPIEVGQPGGVKVAILSFLFNWPSTGGGIIHTVELAQFLAKAGYEVKHFYARHLPWGVGCVESAPPFASEALDFNEATWTVPQIQDRFRQAVDTFGPDHVLITDSWNVKPLLAEAVRDYPYILRFQALECLCPLNNVRLLLENGRFRQCALHQLANPAECARCIGERGHQSGSLHQAERALSGVDRPGYHERLVRAIKEAEAVLVVNPLTEAMMSPYARCVRVVTAGMDPARFPWPWPDEPQEHGRKPLKIFFAGIVEELLKGFHVLHDACSILWRRRQDFELVATGDPPGRVDEFTRFVGWLSQADLPRQMRSADICLVPTIAQEALGRTAVEAMAVGRPVVASRLGGLPFTVVDGATGLLCEPGDAGDLARKIEMLLDDAELRQRLGLAGRRRFEEHYSWDVIIERHYRPLLSRRRQIGAQNGA